MVRVAAIVGRSGRLDNSACSWNATLNARQSSLQLQLRSVFRHPLRLLTFAKLLGQQIDAAGVAISWVRTTENHCRPRQDHHVVTALFDIVVGEDSTQEAALSAARSAIGRPPLSKFGIDARLTSVMLADADTDGYWYSSGRFWNTPDTERPTEGEPHVVARFKPEPDLIDDTPYA